MSRRRCCTVVSAVIVFFLLIVQVTHWQDLHNTRLERYGPSGDKAYTQGGAKAVDAGSDDGAEDIGEEEEEEEEEEEGVEEEEAEPPPVAEEEREEHLDVHEDTQLVPDYSAQSPLCVALAASFEHFENALTVINSTLIHSSKPHLLKFRIITAKTDIKAMMDEFHRRLPASVDLQCVAFDPWLLRVSRLVGGSSSGRAELFNELNFAAFYVHEVLPEMARVLYVDTDVVVLSDVQAELSEWDMRGRPVAGARDCSQRVGKYIFFQKMEELKIGAMLPLPMHARREDCVVNRGVVLVDTVAWKTTNMTGMIEMLVQKHLSEDGPLWHSGVSQPPFLLAIAGRYMNMGWLYNVRGLGRADMSISEVKHFKHSYLWSKHLDDFLFVCKFGPSKNSRFAPMIVPQAHRAKVIHFNGRLKPGNRARRSDLPVKTPSRSMADADREYYESRPLCECGKGCVTECAGIWWRYNTAFTPKDIREERAARVAADNSGGE